MEWVKLHLHVIRSQEYIGSDPVARATWLNLLAYCADKENGGIIRRCKGWKDRMWQQLCCVTREETLLVCELYKWKGEDLVVQFYPEETESLVRKRREAGRAGATSRWQKDDLPIATTERAIADKTRQDKRREELSRPEADACGEFDWSSIQDWLDLVGKAVPDRHRAESLAREFLDEMESCKWIIGGEKVRKPLALLVDRLKKDRAYTPKGSK